MKAMRSFFLLLLFVACIMAFTQPPAGLQAWAQNGQEKIERCQSQPQPRLEAPGIYARVMGHPAIFLKPTNGWVCRCVIVSPAPLCSCIVQPVAEDGQKMAPGIPIYFDATAWDDYPGHMIGF